MPNTTLHYREVVTHNKDKIPCPTGAYILVEQMTLSNKYVGSDQYCNEKSQMKKKMDNERAGHRSDPGGLIPSFFLSLIPSLSLSISFFLFPP
jgi:hypothetical protein